MVNTESSVDSQRNNRQIPTDADASRSARGQRGGLAGALCSGAVSADHTLPKSSELSARHQGTI